MIFPTKDEIEIIEKLLKVDDKKDIILNKLNKYVELILMENQKHNLIGKNTVENIWTRHIIDSLQLCNFIEKHKNCSSIVDLGSGSGFPIIVLGIVLNKKIILVEKSQVKAQFLDKTCKSLGLNYLIFNESINKNNIKNIISKHSIITSRAFKSIYEIFDLIKQQENNIDAIYLLKGKKCKTEIDECNAKNKILLNGWNTNITNSILNEGYVVEFLKK